MSAEPISRYTPEEYLSLERTSETKHEYFAGEIYAMAGASLAHNVICGNLMYLLKGALRDSPCDAVQGDMRVQVMATGLYTYPDLAVLCGDPEFSDGQADTLLNPRLLIEVLSPSTESYDRGKKFEHYRQLDSLQEYLLVSQEKAHIDRFVKRSDGRWLLDDAEGLEGVLTLESVAAALPLAEVYRRVEFGQEEQS